MDNIAIIAKWLQKSDYLPTGKNDSGKRWYPSESEICSCCNNIRSPSRAYPWSLWNHCRSLKHIRNIILEKPHTITDVPEALKMTKETAPLYINTDSKLLRYVRDVLLGIYNKGDPLWK